VVAPQPPAAIRRIAAPTLPHVVGFRSALNQSGVASPRRLMSTVNLQALVHSPKHFLKTLFTEPGFV
jgi:hypothetical protein